MSPKLLHIYGPFFLQTYGVCIAIGMVVFAWLLYKDLVCKAVLSEDFFYQSFAIGALAAFVGGRVLFGIMQHFGSLYEYAAFWEGGFAILGSVLGVLLIIPAFFKYNNVHILPVLDRAALYAPLLQSIARIGCLAAGCCYGSPTTGFFAMVYEHPDSVAPLGVALYPTQLYSSMCLLGIFCVLYALQNYFKKDGQLMGGYLFLSSLERLILDEFRGDRVFFPGITWLSNYQYVALGIMVCSCAFLYYVSYEWEKTGTKAS